MNKNYEQILESADAALGRLNELHYRKAHPTNPLHIPAKRVYDEFFKYVKSKGVMFNQLKAEEALEDTFVGIGQIRRTSQSIMWTGTTGELVVNAYETYLRYMGIR